jgi:hypothetical protein
MCDDAYDNIYDADDEFDYIYDMISEMSTKEPLAPSSHLHQRDTKVQHRMGSTSVSTWYLLQQSPLPQDSDRRLEAHGSKIVSHHDQQPYPLEDVTVQARQIDDTQGAASSTAVEVDQTTVTAWLDTVRQGLPRPIRTGLILSSLLRHDEAYSTRKPSGQCKLIAKV